MLSGFGSGSTHVRRFATPRADVRAHPAGHRQHRRRGGVGAVCVRTTHSRPAGSRSWPRLTPRSCCASVACRPGWPRALAGTLATALAIAMANFGIAAAQMGRAVGMLPWESMAKLGLDHAWTLARLAKSPRAARVAGCRGRGGGDRLPLGDHIARTCRSAHPRATSRTGQAVAAGSASTKRATNQCPPSSALSSVTSAAPISAPSP